MTEKSNLANKQRKCPRCGHLLDHLDTICRMCGKKTPVKPPAKDHLFQVRFDT